MESTVSEAEGSGKRGRGSEQGTPAVLCLMQLLQSDVGTVSPIARSAILSLLESLLSSVATQHISDTYRRPRTATVRDHATASAAAALAKINAQAASDADMDQGERQAGAAAGEAAANAPEAPATVATPDAGTSAAAGAGPDSASGVWSHQFACTHCPSVFLLRASVESSPMSWLTSSVSSHARATGYMLGAPNRRR